MANQPDKLPRSILPMPDLVQHGLTTYDAKDPDTNFPPIRELRPPEGAPNVLIILLDDRRLWRFERLRRSVRHAELREAGGRRPALQPLPHHRPVRPDACGAAHRAQPPFGRHGHGDRDRNLGAGIHLAATEQ